MLKYRFNVFDALQRKGYTIYKVQREKLLSADTMQKLKKEDTAISLKSLEVCCRLLDMQPKDIIFFDEEN